MASYLQHERMGNYSLYPVDKSAAGPSESVKRYSRHLYDQNSTHLLTQRNLSSTAIEAKEQQDDDVCAALGPFVEMKMEQLTAYDEDCRALL
ncbi:uncharacterized protein MAM_06910 [Metarhizium album ARSEF 1941]|uniref:Uncharacterized protein n=1 Tax=Metarhizium album (strain ARSEF 1941) TaxID=1081103 RepID=A0A0B2WNH1_METAS|nr:uncharacterized protein MAM_06910 [Metarhizium album ARSEF 1941]KHN95199.1 hypothetical protein MAM_06910 [Metarhizium album ARSEF 1941]